MKHTIVFVVRWIKKSPLWPVTRRAVLNVSAILTIGALLFTSYSAHAAPTNMPEVASRRGGWAVYNDVAYGFSIKYPEHWTVEMPLANSAGAPGVIERRLLFRAQLDGINVDIFPNPEGVDLETWYKTYQSRFVPPSGVLQRGLVVGGEDALYSLDPGDGQLPPRHTVVLAHGDHVYRIEYQAIDSGPHMDTYRTMLESLTFTDSQERGVQLFDMVDVHLMAVSPMVEGCCGYTDPNYNPYPMRRGQLHLVGPVQASRYGWAILPLLGQRRQVGRPRSRGGL